MGRFFCPGCICACYRGDAHRTKNDHVRTGGRGVSKIIRNKWPVGVPVTRVIFPTHPDIFRGYNDAVAPLHQITMHCCIGFLWGLLRPAIHIPMDSMWIISFRIQKAMGMYSCAISDLHLKFDFCIIPHATTRSVGRVVMQRIANPWPCYSGP